MEAREILLTGRLDGDSLAAWISHRAHLLNLSGWLCRDSAQSASIVVVGASAMLEAMEVSCSLGPADVMVETISSQPYRLDQQPEGFSVR